ncbi:methyltransferase domain-containing protein [Streptomyces sp. NPDC050400]|uniref:methyltransferase domain-containing protein n=1 Tax=Streptomyces sp. NPDC050400 TaxID=3365610 RepID=UPI0037B3138C
MKWPDTDTAVALREAFAARTVPDPASAWRQPFARVPRHVFVPRFYEQDSDGAWTARNWGDEGYLDAVYRDEALTTQLDDQQIPTSSSSQPSVMHTMLDALDPQPGHQILELGTGTGYNLALLVDRVGDSHVVSLEPDTELAATAIRHLQQTGHAPMVIAADGLQGYARRAPYDRIIATVGLTHIPPALVDQAVPGGRIVVPLGYGIAVLTVTGPERAEGRFLSAPAYFMPVRGERATPDFAAASAAPATVTKVEPEQVTGRLKFVLALALPGHATCTFAAREGERPSVGLWLPDGSTAIVRADGHAHQSGPTRLWDIVERAAAELPEQIERTRFRVEIAPGRQMVSFDGGPHWRLDRS